MTAHSSRTNKLTSPQLLTSLALRCQKFTILSPRSQPHSVTCRMHASTSASAALSHPEVPYGHPIPSFVRHHSPLLSLVLRDDCLDGCTWLIGTHTEPMRIDPALGPALHRLRQSDV